MAKVTNVNIDCTTFQVSQLLYDLKVLLVSCGWTVTSSGTGTAGTYNGSGDAITTVNIMDQARAWYVIADPAGKVWLCIQRTTSNTNYRIKVARSAFSGGSPDAQTVPSSTSERVVLGSGSDASPTGAAFTSGLVVSPRGHLIAYDAAENAAGIRPFYAFMSGSTPTLLGAMCLEAFADNTYSTANADPWALAHGTGNNVFSLSGGNVWSWYYSPGIVWATPTPIAQPYTTVYLAGSTGVGVDPWGSFDQGFPSFLARGSAQSQPGLAGWLKNIRLRGVVRGYPDTYTTGGGETYVYVGECAIPYANGVTPL